MANITIEWNELLLQAIRQAKLGPTHGGTFHRHCVYFYL